MVIQDKHRHYHSDDSSGEEEVEESASIPARQAQFTVRLLLDFLPRDILDIFRYGLSVGVARITVGLYLRFFWRNNQGILRGEDSLPKLTQI